jgi:hypothetical protein
MIGNIEISFAPDGQVLNINLPLSIRNLPYEQRASLYCEISDMLSGLHMEEKDMNPVARIGGVERIEEDLI